MSVAALVLAAGRGERLGATLPKAFVRLAERPLILRSLSVLDGIDEIESVVPVVAEADLTRFAALDVGRLKKVAAVVRGGAERQDSMRSGLDAVPPQVEWVAVHDAARCLVAPADVTRVIEAARETGAAILARRARDTVKRVRDGFVVETPDRSECWVAQTPQVFRCSLLREALAKAEADGVIATDDAQLVERLGVAVRVVEGRSINLKITLPEDLAAAEAWLREEAT